jgi:hypothetical protein
LPFPAPAHESARPDKFEQSGLDGLKAAGCAVVYQPDLKDEALRTAIRRPQRMCWSCAARR